MFKVLDLPLITSDRAPQWGKRQETGSIFSPFPPMWNPWSQANSLTTVILFSVLFCFFFCERIKTKKKVYFDLSSGHLETACLVG